MRSIRNADWFRNGDQTRPCTYQIWLFLRSRLTKHHRSGLPPLVRVFTKTETFVLYYSQYASVGDALSVK